MPAGRPLTFEDGLYDAGQLRQAFSSDFVREKDLCKFIEENIEEFARDIAEIDLAEYKREYGFGRTQRRFKHSRRIDFLLISKSGERIGVECKHPSSESETTAAIGQCLGYIALFEGAGTPLNRMIIVSSKMDVAVPLVITKFNLPLSFVVMDKGKMAKYIGPSNRIY